MSPLLAVTLVFGLVLIISLCTFYADRQKVSGLALRHFGLSGLAGPWVWLFNLFIGWGAVRTDDALLRGFAVLFMVGIGAGLATALALFFEQWWAALLNFLTNSVASPVTETAQPTAPKIRLKKRKTRLPAPNEANHLVWCADCRHWSPATAVHEHSF